MGLVFGLLTALAIGASDLFGRRVSEAQSPLTSTVAMQFIGIFTVVAALLAVPSDFSAKAAGLGAISGFGFAVGLGCYHTGLKRASATLMAPMVAMLSAVLPFGFTVFRGAEPSTLTYAGAFTCLVGLGIITINRDDIGVDWVSLRWGTLSGLGYAGGLIALIDVSDESGMWPAVSQRIVACVTLLLAALAAKAPLVPAKTLRVTAVLAGIAAGFSTIFVLLGLGIDPTPTVVGWSLFPAIAVVVGLVVYGDSVRRAQWLGIAAVVVGVIAVSIG